MRQGSERHLFPGNNTPRGFYSYYHYILPQHEANHIFCLKGGPGVGKSTFMKRVGRRMQERGYAVEYLHCSSDPGSLDGVVIPELRVSLIDGTAPHVVDPKNPGAVDEIINLGEYWDLEGIKQHKEKVIAVNGEVGRLFRRAYHYLGAAKALYDDIIEIYERATDLSGVIKESEHIKDEIFTKPVSDKLGKVRKQFASAITPDGVIDYLNTLFDHTYHVCAIKNHWGIGVSKLLKRISDEAVIRGMDTELYYCPFEPDKKIEHVIIPSIKRAYVTVNDYYTVERKNSVIDLRQYTNNSLLDSCREAIHFDTKHFEVLLDEGVATIHKAKRTHDDMEKYYIPYMDFDKEKEKMEEIVQRILGLVN